MIDTTVSHYRILRALGRGGMGEVYAAEDTKLHRQVALKILPRDLATDPERLRRFQREAQAIAALSHPNVVTVYSVEEADGLHFLTMELVDGKTLVDVLPPHGFPFDRFLKLAVPLADAVGAAHQRGVVHRDLKPANIMIADDGRLKVLDFGLAKLKVDEGAAADASQLTTAALTGEHRVLGTAAYMSPEQAEGRPVDVRSDVFSLGVVLYEMATGERPFKGDTTVSVISSIIKDAPPPLSTVNPKMPGGVDRVVRRALAKDPSRRYQSAVDVRNDLEELGEIPRARPSLASRPVLYALAGVAVFAAAAAVALMVRRDGGAAQPSGTFTKLTSMPGREWFPSLSPDGKWIAYAGEAAGNFDIYLQSISGSNPLNLTADSPADDDMPVFSPDGERIAFRSSRDGGGIFMMGRTGEAVKRLTRFGFNPSWAPDGSAVAFTSGRIDVNPQNSEGRTELFVVGIGGGEPRRLAEADVITPSWSPHNRRIAFAKRLAGYSRRTDIYTIPVEGGAPTALMNDPPYDWSPIWAPDGRHVYFTSDRGGTMNLWRIAVDEDSGQPRGQPEPIVTPAPFFAHPAISADGAHLAYSSVLMTTNVQKIGIDPTRTTTAGDPAWITSGSRLWSDPDPSPDGTLVVFYSGAEPIGDLYVSRTDGTGLRQLTSDPAADRLPRWSPDGAWISMFSNRSGRLQIWRIRPDGSDLQQVTEMQSGAAYSAWSSDGSRLVVSTIEDQHPALYVVDPSRRQNEQRLEKFPSPPEPPPPGGQRGFRVNSWSPNGQHIVGDQGATGLPGIFMYTLGTRTWERVTEFGEWPVWLSDSRHVLFGDGGRNFWIVDVRTKETKRLYSSGRDVFGPPRVTRDGRAIVYTRRVNEADVWLMTLR
jgi:eukaryotic-like serine/threonine-protein kinase